MSFINLDLNDKQSYDEVLRIKNQQYEKNQFIKIHKTESFSYQFYAA